MADSTPLIAFLADRDVSCPGCGYNLRGLQTPACPECGRVFEPPDMRRALRKPPRRPWVVLAAGIISHLLLCGVLLIEVISSRHTDAMWLLGLPVPPAWAISLIVALTFIGPGSAANREEAAHLAVRWGWALLIVAGAAVIAFPILAVL